jgi:hypothetical protein
MAIVVVCPGCRKSFQLSDKFAGKSGPCPNCNQIIQVPKVSEQVQLHEPTPTVKVGRGPGAHKAVPKPIERTDAKFDPMQATLIVAAVLVVLVVTWIGGRVGLFDHMVVSVVGMVLISPPLVVGAYIALWDDELEPYRGRSLYWRATLCSVVYAVLWGLLILMAARGIISGDIWIWLFVIPPVVVVGSLLAHAILDLDFGDAAFHCGFYLIVIMLLRWIAGLQWVWNLSR